MQQEEYSTIKSQLIEECLRLLEAKSSSAQQAMQQAQETANDQRGSMGDKYETFRAQMQADRDMYARQYAEAQRMMETVKKIDAAERKKTPSLGALVYTESQVFFVSVSLGTVEAEGKKYVAISAQSPIFLAMAGKKASEKFLWRGKEEKVLDVY